MPEGAAIGLWIIGAIALVALLVSAFIGISRKDEEEQDIEHLDHEIRGGLDS